MRSSSWVIGSLLAVVVAGFASQARADHYGLDVTVRNGYPGLIAVTVTAYENGFVDVPRGTVLTDGSHQNQDLAMGVEIRREMRAGERVTVTMPAFCLHQERPALATGVRLRRAGMAQQALSPILRNFEKRYLAAKAGREAIVSETQHAVWTEIRRPRPGWSFTR
ncbi:MAG: hypothetical protein IT379_35875 [Deltaproteobacteria bacterium]|nr:hypothetical protein [Deltaproteobacteria bacterium]